MNLLVGEAEGGFSVEDQVQLLLPARALVVFVDQCLIGTARHEEVDTERVDAERVLKWIPGGIVRVAVGDRRYRGDPLHRPTRHPRSLGRACGSIRETLLNAGAADVQWPGRQLPSGADVTGVERPARVGRAQEVQMGIPSLRGKRFWLREMDSS